MPKRYQQWLDNSVAIDLRNLAERQEKAFEKISALRHEEYKLQRLLDDVRQDLQTAQLDFRGINFEITKILREHVPRFIQCGNMIIPDNNKIISIEDRR